MKHFIAPFLLFAISISGVGQQTEKPQTQKVTPKAAAKTQKTKPKTTLKTQKAPSKNAAKNKAKTKSAPKITIIEAATIDGKAVTLKSNGTWEYTKAEEPVAKTTAKPEPTPEKTPKIVAKSTPTPTSKTPSPVVKSTPVAAPTPVAKTKPTPLPTQCDLTLKDAPIIRGLKLGMPRNEADKIIPLERVTILDSSDIRAYPKPGGAGSFENVFQVTARFNEDRLDALQIEYDADAIKWKSAKDFAENISANLNLPARFWRHNAKNPITSEMQCKEFLIKINSSLNEIEIEKLTAAQQKNESENQGQKKIFKP